MERLTNQQAKEAAIREAYGKQFEAVKGVVCADGSIPVHIAMFLDCPNDEWHYYHDNLRPNTLKGMESNNSWERIQPDGSNLPDELDERKFTGRRLDENGDWHDYDETWDRDQLFREFRHHFVTHYRPKEVLPKPIY